MDEDDEDHLCPCDSDHPAGWLHDTNINHNASSTTNTHTGTDSGSN